MKHEMSNEIKQLKQELKQMNNHANYLKNQMLPIQERREAPPPPPSPAPFPPLLPVIPQPPLVTTQAPLAQQQTTTVQSLVQP